MSPEPRVRAGRIKRNLPNTITVLSLCSGLTAIRMMLDDQLEFAVALILVAIVLDGLDGKVARLFNVSSRFGAELDSLADFLCFGIAPGLVLYRHLFEGTNIARLGWMVVLILIISCMLRLARFNVASAELLDDGAPPDKHFTGVPAPALAFLALTPIYLFESDVMVFKDYPVLSVMLLLIIASLAVSTVPTISFKQLKLSVLMQRRYVFLLAVVLATGLSFPWIFLGTMSALYICSIVYLMLRETL